MTLTWSDANIDLDLNFCKVLIGGNCVPLVFQNSRTGNRESFTISMAEYDWRVSDLITIGVANTSRLSVPYTLEITLGSSSSPTPGPTPTPAPNFQGAYGGNWITSNGCTETVSGACRALGFDINRSLGINLSLTQTQMAVTGTGRMAMPPPTFPSLGAPSMSLRFNGQIQPSGQLTGTILGDGHSVSLPNGTAVQFIQIAGWTATLSGNNLSGSFRLVYSSATVSGNLVAIKQ